MPTRPTYPGVHIEEVGESGTPIDAVLTTTTAFVGALPEGPENTPVEVLRWGDFLRTFGRPAMAGSQVAHPVRQFFENGGSRAFVVRVASPDHEHLIGDPAARSGIHALDAVGALNLLCVPDTAGLEDGRAAAVIAAAQRYCEHRRAFYLVDLPQRDGHRDEVDEIRAWLDAHPHLRSPNAALYVPPLLLPDAPRACSPSGAVAGIYVRTDSRWGVWKAPAGTEARLRGTGGLRRAYSDRDGDVLNPLGVNLIRTFAQGPVLWGARTMLGTGDQASEWKYVPVRRLALFLEVSISRGTEWAVFEPNDEALWSRLRSTVESFLHDLFRQGAFAGRTGAEAYFVQCDDKTTTRPDIDQGVVNILVGFAPIKPAEFVVIRLRQRAKAA